MGGINRNIDIINRIGLFVSSFLLLLFISPYTTLLNQYYGYDTAIWNVIGKGIAEGLVPYRDLFDHKGPILFFIYGLAWKTGYHREMLFCFQWLFLVIDVLFMYKLCFLVVKNRVKAYICVLFFYFLLCSTIGEGGMCEEWSLPFIVIPLFYSYRYIMEKRKEHPWYLGCIYGICFGIIAGIRLNNGLPVCMVVLFLLILFIGRKDYLTIGKNAIGFLTGMFLTWIPLLIWFGRRKALWYLWWGAFEFNFRYASNSDTLRTRSESLRLLSLWLIIAFWIVYTIRMYRDKSEQRLVSLYMLCSVSVTILFIMPGAGFMHYFMVLIPYVTIGMCELFLIDFKKDKAGVILSICMLCIPFTWDAIRNAGKNYLFITKGYYSEMHQEIRDFMNQIPESDKDSVWGNGTGFSKVYCISGITPCFQYFDNAPIHYAIDERMLEETNEMLEIKPPKWIVVTNLGEPKIEGLQEFVIENYDLIDELHGEKTLQLYRHHIE